MEARQRQLIIAHNLRQVWNILTINVLKEYLRILPSLFMCQFDLKWVNPELPGELGYVIPEKIILKAIQGIPAWFESVIN